MNLFDEVFSAFSRVPAQSPAELAGVLYRVGRCFFYAGEGAHGFLPRAHNSVLFLEREFMVFSHSLLKKTLVLNPGG